MRRLHLKLFYLRTRFKREPQGVTAKKLGVRPATMSHLEQGRSLPTLPMLEALCRHYDVTPTYLLDDSRPIEPQLRDRWSEREALICRGDWLEVPDGAAIKASDGTLLCPVMGNARFYDSTQQAQRMLCQSEQEATTLEQQFDEKATEHDKSLEEMLRNELLAQRKPRTKSKPRAAATDNGILKKAPGNDADGGRLAAEA